MWILCVCLTRNSVQWALCSPCTSLPLHLSLPLSQSNPRLSPVLWRATFFCLFWSCFLWPLFNRFFYFLIGKEIDLCSPIHPLHTPPSSADSLNPQSCSFCRITEQFGWKGPFKGFLVQPSLQRSVASSPWSGGSEPCPAWPWVSPGMRHPPPPGQPVPHHPHGKIFLPGIQSKLAPSV